MSNKFKIDSTLDSWPTDMQFSFLFSYMILFYGVVKAVLDSSFPFISSRPLLSLFAILVPPFDSDLLKGFWNL